MTDLWHILKVIGHEIEVPVSIVKIVEGVSEANQKMKIMLRRKAVEEKGPNDLVGEIGT